MATPTRSIVDRMKGAALLDVPTYEEVEADTSATGQAATVVAIVAWLLWSGITYLIGDKLLGGTATWGELLRTLGFAQAPGVLSILGIVPILGGLVRAIV